MSVYKTLLGVRCIFVGRKGMQAGTRDVETQRGRSAVRRAGGGGDKELPRSPPPRASLQQTAGLLLPLCLGERSLKCPGGTVLDGENNLNPASCRETGTPRPGAAHPPRRSPAVPRSRSRSRVGGSAARPPLPPFPSLPRPLLSGGPRHTCPEGAGVVAMMTRAAQC